MSCLKNKIENVSKNNNLINEQKAAQGHQWSSMQLENSAPEG